MGNSNSNLSVRSRASFTTPRASVDVNTIKTWKSTEALNSESNEANPSGVFAGLPRTKQVSKQPATNFDILTGKIISRPKTSEDWILIKKALSQHFIFTNLPDENVEEVIEAMKLYSLKPKKIVFYQGNPGNKFFIIAKGSVEIIINGSVKGILKAGQSFGELALIHDSKRTATIRTAEAVLLWTIERQEFRDTVKALNSLEYEENKVFLKSVPFLQHLRPGQIESLLAGSVSQYFIHGQNIVMEGDPGGIFYIIQEGTVECSANGKVFRSLSKGEYFGEQALLYQTNRTATVTALRKVKVLSFGREVLETAIGSNLQYMLYRNSLRISFDTCEYLKNLTQSQKEEIIDQIEVLSFASGEIAVPKGASKNRYLWIVLKGSLSSGYKTVSRSENIGAKWMYFKKSGFVKENFIADCDVDAGLIRTDAIVKVIKGELEETVLQNYIIKILKQLYMFRVISENKLALIAKSLKTVEFEKNKEIFAQGDMGESFYIVKEGEVQICKDSKVIRTICKGNYFGERSILLNESRTASATSKTKCSLWVLSREDFLSVIDDTIYSLLLKRMHLQDDSTTLSDLSIVHNLGKGTYGTVYLCVKKQTNFLYALKTISRKKINSFNLQPNLALEKTILQRVEHQFIVKFVKSFSDSKRIYFLLEYIQGLSLFDVLRVLGLTGTSRCRFYASCILLILEHLHQNSIIYRDLKPENIMVEPDGYLKLLDFGTAKIINGKTYTVIGTPYYMAPEVILGKGYNESADLWSFGIVVYEMLSGSVPFGKNTEDDPFAVYKEVITGKYSFPYFVTEESKEFIQKLLSHSSHKRGTADELKRHKWFMGNEWESILSRMKVPPYKPEAESNEKMVEMSLEQDCSVETVLNRGHDDSEVIEPNEIKKYICEDWDKDF